MCYHAINRGNARAEVFHKEDDYAAFVRLVEEACERLPMRVLAYCLMPNHFHMVLWPWSSAGMWRKKELPAWLHVGPVRYEGNWLRWVNGRRRRPKRRPCGSASPAAVPAAARCGSG